MRAETAEQALGACVAPSGLASSYKQAFGKGADTSRNARVFLCEAAFKKRGHSRTVTRGACGGALKGRAACSLDSIVTCRPDRVRRCVTQVARCFR